LTIHDNLGCVFVHGYADTLVLSPLAHKANTLLAIVSMDHGVKRGQQSRAVVLGGVIVYQSYRMKWALHGLMLI